LASGRPPLASHLCSAIRVARRASAHARRDPAPCALRSKSTRRRDTNDACGVSALGCGSSCPASHVLQGAAAVTPGRTEPSSSPRPAARPAREGARRSAALRRRGPLVCQPVGPAGHRAPAELRRVRLERRKVVPQGMAAARPAREAHRGERAARVARAEARQAHRAARAALPAMRAADKLAPAVVEPTLPRARLPTVPTTTRPVPSSPTRPFPTPTAMVTS
jgi:hypothetical protein